MAIVLAYVFRAYTNLIILGSPRAFFCTDSIKNNGFRIIIMG